MEEKINRRGRKKKEIDGVFAERLSELLKSKKEQGIIQDTVASTIGVSRQALGKWANGETVPDILDLKKLANYFEVSADYLLGLSDLTEGDITLKKASEHTGIPEKTLYNISRLYNLENDFPGVDMAYTHKFHTFFFYESKKIDGIINGYINSLYDSFENAYNEMIKEAPANGNNNPEDK